jgi:hypothetical protein
MRPHGISSVDVPDERRGTGGRFPTDLLPLVRGRGCLELDHPDALGSSSMGWSTPPSVKT